jgi:nitroreductase
MEFKDVITKRRSIRKYTGEPLGSAVIEAILEAGLRAPSGRGTRDQEFILVEDKAMLYELSGCKRSGVGMIKECDAAIVVMGDTAKTDTWIEDCSNAIMMMHLAATDLGAGSCWIQCRGRSRDDGIEADAYVKELLGIPDNYGILAVLAIGMPADDPAPRTVEELEPARIHRGKF